MQVSEEQLEAREQAVAGSTAIDAEQLAGKDALAAAVSEERGPERERPAAAAKVVEDPKMARAEAALAGFEGQRRRLHRANQSTPDTQDSKGTQSTQDTQSTQGALGLSSTERKTTDPGADVAGPGADVAGSEAVLPAVLGRLDLQPAEAQRAVPANRAPLPQLDPPRVLIVAPRNGSTCVRECMCVRRARVCGLCVCA
jgi:hypothetical protein